MRIIIFILFIICFAITGCIPIVTVYYEVSARKDPFLKNKIVPSTFAFLPDSTNPDAVIEKYIFYYIDSTLIKMGWQSKPIDEAEYVISTKFNIDDRQNISSQEVGGYYDKKTQKYVSGQQETQTTYYYEKVIKINLFKGVNRKEYVWSADCATIGDDKDILSVAKYMVSYAIKKMPQEGSWKNSEFIK